MNFLPCMDYVKALETYITCSLLLLSAHIFYMRQLHHRLSISTLRCILEMDCTLKHCLLLTRPLSCEYIPSLSESMATISTVGLIFTLKRKIPWSLRVWKQLVCMLICNFIKVFSWKLHVFLLILTLSSITFRTEGLAVYSLWELDQNNNQIWISWTNEKALLIVTVFIASNG